MKIDRSCRAQFQEGFEDNHDHAEVIELIKRGVIAPDESTVVCITGNGYKTTDVMAGRMADPVRLGRGFKEFEGWWESRQALA